MTKIHTFPKKKKIMAMDSIANSWCISPITQPCCALLSGTWSGQYSTVVCGLSSWLLPRGSAVSCCVELCLRPFQSLCSLSTLLLGWTRVALRVNECPGAAERRVSVTLWGAGRPASARGGLVLVWQASATVPPRGISRLVVSDMLLLCGRGLACTVHLHEADKRPATKGDGSARCMCR